MRVVIARIILGRCNSCNRGLRVWERDKDKMQLILVRHGETDWNKQGRYLGNTDLPLSEKGLKQAAELASFVRICDPACLYSSDLIRARHTASGIEKSLSLSSSCVVDRRLREINFGSWEGKTYAELSSREKALSDDWFTDPGSITVPEGEPWREFQNRVLSFVQEIIAIHQEGKIIVVSHGGPIKIIIAHFLGIASSKISRLHISPASISIVDIYGEAGEGFLKLLNWSPDVKHICCGRPASSRGCSLPGEVVLS